MSKWTGFGALGAGLGVALSGLCCLPVAAALGAGVMAVGTVLLPFQTVMSLTSLALLGVAFVQTARVHRCQTEQGCFETHRRHWIFLAAIALVTLVLITLPYWSAYLMLRSL